MSLNVALWRCGDGPDRWFVLSTRPAWIALSFRSSMALTKSGRTAPSGFSHKQLDVTEAPVVFVLCSNMVHNRCCVQNKGHSGFGFERTTLEGIRRPADRASEVTLVVAHRGHKACRYEAGR